MPATSPDNLRYPQPSDNPNVPRDIGYLAADTQAALAPCWAVATANYGPAPVGGFTITMQTITGQSGGWALGPSQWKALQVPRSGVYLIVYRIRYTGPDNVHVWGGTDGGKAELVARGSIGALESEVTVLKSLTAGQQVPEFQAYAAPNAGASGSCAVTAIRISS